MQLLNSNPQSLWRGSRSALLRRSEDKLFVFSSISSSSSLNLQWNFTASRWIFKQYIYLFYPGGVFNEAEYSKWLEEFRVQPGNVEFPILFSAGMSSEFPRLPGCNRVCAGISCKSSPQIFPWHTLPLLVPDVRFFWLPVSSFCTSSSLNPGTSLRLHPKVFQLQVFHLILSWFSSALFRVFLS